MCSSGMCSIAWTIPPSAMRTPDKTLTSASRSGQSTQEGFIARKTCAEASEGSRNHNRLHNSAKSPLPHDRPPIPDWNHWLINPFLLEKEMLEKGDEMRQNSLERKENYGFGFLLHKVPLSYFPPQHPQKCAISFACIATGITIDPPNLDF